MKYQRELMHAVEGLNPREMNHTRFIIEVARNKGLDLEDLAILLKVSQKGKINEEVRLDGITH